MNFKLSGWDLNEIKPKNIAFALKEIERETLKLEKKRKELNNNITPDKFLRILKELEQLRKETSKLSSYVGLKFAENSADQQALAEMSQVETALTKFGNRLLFFGLWFKDLPENKARELIEHSGPYCYHLEQLRKLKDRFRMEIL